MRRIATFFILGAFLLTQASPFIAFAQKKNIDVKDFDVSIPTETVKVNEAFDLTVKATDTTGKKITDYEGTVYFDNVNRPPADVVLPSFGDEWYTFQLSDQGEHTFSKGFTFKKAGVYEIDVYEIETAGEGVSKTIKITAVDKDTAVATKADVTITEPVNNTTVSAKTLTVSGTSKINSSINILLNGKKVSTTQTLADGKFSATVGDLVSGSNEITAEVLDGNSAVIGTSQKTLVKYSTDAPKFTSLTIKEGNEFLVGSSLTFVGVGDPSLKSVQVKVDGKVVVLQEDLHNLGTYTGVYKTGDTEAEYSPIVAIESLVGTKAEIKDLVKFHTLKARILNVKTETTTDKKVRFTFDLTPDIDQIKYFEIKYGTETKKYTKTVTTYEKTKIKEDGKYTWYIPGLEPGEYFSTIIGLDKDKKETSITSDEQTFTLALDAAPTCFIEKISGIKVNQGASFSTISWDTQKEAASYQVFKKDSSGQFAIIDEVKTNQYRINFDTTAKQITYDDFRVRGICKNGTYVGQGDFSESVKVQTGPELIVFFALFIASGIAFILVRRGYLN